jgi:DNA-binding NarL/FixJ family response regulator
MNYLLTPRQRQVVELVAAGCSNEEIGRALGISTRTVKAYTDAIRDRLGARRRSEIPLAYFRKTGTNPLGGLPDAVTAA